MNNLIINVFAIYLYYAQYATAISLDNVKLTYAQTFMMNKFLIRT